MKNFLKNFLTINNLLLIVIIIAAAAVRFYNFPDRVTFGPEQAISLETSASMIKEKFSLLGIENVQRTTSQGLKIYSGALFSYSLIPLLLIFNYQALPLSACFTILNILTGLILYFVSRKMFGVKTAIFSLILFIFNSYMIYHSLFIWILDYLPLIGILTLYFLYQEKTNFKYRQIFWLGILSGIGISLEYLYGPTYLLVLVLAFYFSKKRIKTFLVFFFSSLIPNLPIIVFDLKHNFYNSKVLWLYFQDVLKHPENSGILYYDFLQFWPIAALILGFLVVKIWDKNKLVVMILITIYLFINIHSTHVIFGQPTGMPKDLTINNIDFAAAAIKKDNPSDFNVAVINDFDTRGHILRYPLEFNNNLFPGGVEDYPSSEILYVLAPLGYNFSKVGVWEIQSFNFKKEVKISDVGKNFGLFKLSK